MWGWPGPSPAGCLPIGCNGWCAPATHTRRRKWSISDILPTYDYSDGLRRLEALRRCDELGSLSKVAIAYGTSQPHISRQIGDLEQEVRRPPVPAHGTGRRADRVRRTDRTQGPGVAREHRSARQRYPCLRRHADRKGAARHPSFDRASARVDAVPSLAGAISARAAGIARRARARNSRHGLRTAASISRSCSGTRTRRATAMSTWCRRRPTWSARTATPLTAKSTVPFAKLHQSAAGPVLPTQQLARSPGRDQRRARRVVQRRPRGGLAGSANSHGCGRRRIRTLGAYAVSAAAKELRIRTSRLIEPTIKRHIALAMSRHGELTLACRTVMHETQDIARKSAAEAAG